MDVPLERDLASYDFCAALATASRSIILTDGTQPNNPIVFVNDAFTNITGYSQEEAIGRNCRFLQGPGTDQGVVAEIREALANGRSIRREVLNYRKNGEAFWNDLTIDPVRDKAGKVTSFIGIQHDETRCHAALLGRLEAEERLANIANTNSGYAFRRIMHPDGTIVFPYISPSFFRILGLPPGVGMRTEEGVEYLHPDDRDPILKATRQSATSLTPMLIEYRLISPAGKERWFRNDSTPRALANGDIVWDGMAIDITAEKSSELQLSHLAYHDGLTGLSNRLLFKSLTIKAISAVDIAVDKVALFYIDVDDFQAFNDQWGQAFGDGVLFGIGQRLAEFSELRGGSAARLGGDEFAILLPSVPQATPPLELVEIIGRELRSPTLIDRQEVVIEVCVGAAVFPFAGETHQTGAEGAAAELLKQAQSALQAAKQNGPGTSRLYSAEHDDRLQNRAALRHSLHQAIIQEQFQLHYQPLVDLASGEIVGAEALVRWIHPEFGLQRPDLFIPLAEASGLIVPLGAWVIKDAMKQAQAWRRRGIRTPGIAINVSSIQLQRPGFMACVAQALAETGADPHDFEFELTEGTLIEASREILEQLNALKSLGFGLTIDDFGTGHSTFKYLRDFPIDKIKIDQVFVRQLVIDSSDASIIRAMITLARSLKLKVVAEGIETAMQRNFLRDEGCMTGQGYLFSPPMTAEDFGWALERQLTLPVQDDRPT